MNLSEVVEPFASAHAWRNTETEESDLPVGDLNNNSYDEANIVHRRSAARTDEASQNLTEGNQSSTEDSQCSTECSQCSTECSQCSTECSQCSTEGSQSSTEGSQSSAEDSQSSAEDSQNSTESDQNPTEINPSSVTKVKTIIQIILRLCLHLALEFPDLFLSLSALAMGAAYIGHCPANWLVPWLVFLMGADTASVLIYLWVKMANENYQTPGNIWALHYQLLEFLLFIELIMFYNISSTNDSTDENYCNRTFYYYTSSFNVLIILALFITA